MIYALAIYVLITWLLAKSLRRHVGFRIVFMQAVRESDAIQNAQLSKHDLVQLERYLRWRLAAKWPIVLATKLFRALEHVCSWLVRP